MKNQLQGIAPYFLHGTWVFDDPGKDLLQEPFVGGVPEMIDELVAHILNAQSGFRLLFSAAPFPGHQRRLEWVREEDGGNWYRSDEPPMEGWLCPALFAYFEAVPRQLYVKAEPLQRYVVTAERSILPGYFQDFDSHALSMAARGSGSAKR